MRIKEPFNYYVIKIVGDYGQMLTFAYMVGGWVRQDAYIGNQKNRITENVFPENC